MIFTFSCFFEFAFSIFTLLYGDPSLLAYTHSLEHTRTFDVWPITSSVTPVAYIPSKLEVELYCWSDSAPESKLISRAHKREKNAHITLSISLMLLHMRFFVFIFNIFISSKPNTFSSKSWILRSFINTSGVSLHTLIYV